MRVHSSAETTAAVSHVQMPVNVGFVLDHSGSMKGDKMRCVRDATQRTGLPIAVVIAANRTRHPLDARTLARLAAQYADRGVVGFGLSNDERRGSTVEFAPAFAIAERAGLLLAPHGGELRGPDHVRRCLDDLRADRLGHGVRAVEDPALLDRIVEAGVALEVLAATRSPRVSAGCGHWP